jgi:hypothetical protein
VDEYWPLVELCLFHRVSMSMVPYRRCPMMENDRLFALDNTVVAVVHDEDELDDDDEDEDEDVADAEVVEYVMEAIS